MKKNVQDAGGKFTIQQMGIVTKKCSEHESRIENVW
jgi:hypothetical protein